MNPILFLFTFIKNTCEIDEHLITEILKGEEYKNSDINRNINLLWFLEYHNNSCKIKERLKEIEVKLNHCRSFKYVYLTVNQTKNLVTTLDYILKISIFVLKDTFALVKINSSVSSDKKTFFGTKFLFQETKVTELVLKIINNAKNFKDLVHNQLNCRNEIKNKFNFVKTKQLLNAKQFNSSTEKIFLKR